MKAASILAALSLSCVAFAQKADVIPLADPFILYDDGTYYLYGTGSDNGIPVAVSRDMKEWEWPGDGEGMYLALNKDDSFGNYFFWAPEVYKVGDRYLMLYSAEEHICIAESDSPLGPFRQEVKAPLREHKGIDNHLFIDEDGTPYLFWVHFNNGNEIWVARLSDDCRSIVPGTETFCTKMSQEWEKVWPAVNEGPFVLRHRGKYYLTYSANSYESPAYGIGVAVSDSVTGPWVKSEKNPVLQFAGGLEGVGHHALFTDARGKRRIVFHSHNRPGNIHPRIIHIGEYSFRNGTIRISKDFFTPAMK